ncbi:hypothetical protein CLAIMM_11490 [Cladophialophora immunda]|nr:hypothetical protein CLAIMM_11490 [Cladophialophora immunda]
MATESPFWRPIDICQTALLLSDVQTQLLSHMPQHEQDEYLSRVQQLLQSFRTYISKAQTQGKRNDGIPLIIHHVVSVDFATMNLSPYNKINNWALRRLHAAGNASKAASNADPAATVPESLRPGHGWTVNEFVLTKQAPSCFASSALLKILAARGIKHVVLVGLTTEGSILSSVRHGADLDFHIVVPEEGVWCDDAQLEQTVLERLIPRFADVCTLADVEGLLP